MRYMLTGSLLPTVLALTLLPLTLAAPADIKIDAAPGDPICIVTVAGEIDSSTPTRLRHSLLDVTSKGCTTRIVHLAGPGGDIDAAMEMGRILRTMTTYTAISEGDACASACVVAFLGGIEREPSGRVGLHRPFPTALARTQQESADSLSQLNQRLLAYLRFLSISERVLEAMNRVPPGSVRWLIGSDPADAKVLRELEIFGTDPVYADLQASQLASELGISKQTLFARQQRASVVCNYDPALSFVERWNQDRYASDPARSYTQRRNCYATTVRGLAK